MSASHEVFFRLIKTELWLFEGPDALRFLNGITTPHLSRSAAPGHALSGRGLFLDPKGKLLAPFVFVKESETRVLLRLDIGCHTSGASVLELNQSLYDNVQSVIIADDLRVTRHTASVVQGWGGDQAQAISRAPLPALRPQAQDEVFEIPLGADRYGIPTPYLGDEAFEVWPHLGTTLPLWGAQEATALQIAEAFFNANYLEFPNQLHVGDLPLEFGFADAISFFKGCYRGQETIARATYRGKLVKGLARLHFAHPVELRDTQLTDAEGQIVGEIRVLDAERTCALAVLRFSALEGLSTALAKTSVTQVERLVSEINERFR
ncbi:MAG TPA: hypothetical protein VM901_08550 [Bdellovibrionota bacterium]|jgi:folate-binding protein YgfZ|nr:hypothetical protein [Bdellovibrionota bacterium]